MKKSNAIWGLVLIFIGLFWILGSTNMVEIDLTGALFTLWPLFIIAAGVSMFLNKDAHLMRIIVWVLVFAIIGGYGIYLGYRNETFAGGTNTFEMRDGMKSAKLSVNVGAADFRIGSASTQLATVNSNIQDLKYNFNGGSHSEIRYSQKVRFFNLQSGKKFNADLNNSIPWRLELNTGATEGLIDFSDLILENCNINTGACDLRIIAGDKQEEARIQCNGGAVNISISIPANTGIKVQTSAAVVNVRGNGVNMVKDGRTYYSDNFDSAQKVIILEVNSGASDVTVNLK